MALEVHLSRYTSRGVTLLGDTSRPGGVTFGFSERTGGVSAGVWASLNLGAYCGDDPALVEKNRARALEALGAGAYAERLLTPKQVHGIRVVCVSSSSAEALAEARAELEEGADAVVCTAAQLPVLLYSADCPLVVLVCEGGFALAHSGWPGTLNRISECALTSLCAQTGCQPEQVRAYVGPHISGADYEVSEGLLQQFVGAFGPEVSLPGSRVDLAEAIRLTLISDGVPAEQIAISCDSSASMPERYFSYRASKGECGRQGAIAFIDTNAKGGDACE